MADFGTRRRDRAHALPSSPACDSLVGQRDFGGAASFSALRGSLISGPRAPAKLDSDYSGAVVFLLGIFCSWMLFVSSVVDSLSFKYVPSECPLVRLPSFFLFSSA